MQTDVLLTTLTSEGEADELAERSERGLSGIEAEAEIFLGVGLVFVCRFMMVRV